MPLICIIIGISALYIFLYVVKHFQFLKAHYNFPSIIISKHIKGSKECSFLGQNTTCNFFYQTTKQHLTVKQWKMRWRAKPLIWFWLSYVFASSASKYPLQETFTSNQALASRNPPGCVNNTRLVVLQPSLKMRGHLAFTDHCWQWPRFHWQQMCLGSQK